MTFIITIKPSEIYTNYTLDQIAKRTKGYVPVAFRLPTTKDTWLSCDMDIIFPSEGVVSGSPRFILSKVQTIADVWE